MTKRQAHQEPDGLARLGLILDSKALYRSLPATAWDKLKDANRQSVEHFAVRYATPIFCYYRRKWRLDPEQAKDLTMEFIARKLVGGSLLRSFKLGQYRFRDYLLRALRNFLIDAYRKENKLKLLPLDLVMEDNPDAEPHIDGPVEKEFIRNCTHDQLRAALLRVREECHRDGLEDHFRIFCLREFAEPKQGWDEVGLRFGVGWQEAKNKAWTVKERLRKAVAEEFRMTGMTAAQVKEEIRSRAEVFRGSAGKDFEIPEDGGSCSPKNETQND
jgi:DNA-directed RNA polymerase specialized sigma24 family protein